MENISKNFIGEFSASIRAMVLRAFPEEQQPVTLANPSLHAEIRLNSAMGFAVVGDVLPWRNRLARSAVNRKVGGSSPPGSGSGVCFCNLADYQSHRFFSSKKDAEKLLPEIYGLLLSVKNARNGQSVILPTNNVCNEIIDNVVIVCSDVPEGDLLTITNSSLTLANLHLYKLLNRNAQTLEVELGEHGTEPNSAGSLLWELPCCEFDGMWENLVFDDSIKEELLSYVYALVKLSEKSADSSVLRVNRLILLHGPPGTGKTSLCKALAQKLSIRFSQKYKSIYFVEINSHSLFSKFFSESGKLIQNMFRQIEELAEDSKAFVFVLIDEIESLTIARGALLSRNEPTDAIRAVNAVLTQVDHIRRRNNIFIFTTSNIIQSLDEAFTDRTDLSRLVGYPSADAIYTIFSSCIQEMQRIGVVQPDPWFSKRYANDRHCEKLMQLSRRASGLSGRCLRQLPVIGYSKLPADQLSIDQCLDVLEKAVEEKLTESMRYKQSVSNVRQGIASNTAGFLTDWLRP
uniref:AAA+ ATPase domain-containing protein n=1 Tax=Setaria digitata TaxID=48799 RepID=A0A915Q348_9BILA